jgi:hypothetical protein
MIIARRFNAGSEAEFEKVPKGRMKGPQVLGQFLLPLRVQHQRTPNLITPAFRERLWPLLGGKGSFGLRRSDVSSGLVVVSHRNPALKRRVIFIQSLSGPTSGALIEPSVLEFRENSVKCGAERVRNYHQNVSSSLPKSSPLYLPPLLVMVHQANRTPALKSPQSPVLSAKV